MIPAVSFLTPSVPFSISFNLSSPVTLSNSNTSGNFGNVITTVNGGTSPYQYQYDTVAGQFPLVITFNDPPNDNNVVVGYDVPENDGTTFFEWILRITVTDDDGAVGTAFLTYQLNP